MRITLIDSCLRDYNGHHYEYARSVLDDCRRRGWSANAVIHQSADPAIRSSLRADAVFRHTIYELPSGPARRLRGPLASLWSVLWGNALYVAELRRIPRERLAETDVLFFHTVNERQLPALALWARLHPAARRPALVILLRYRPGLTARAWSVSRLAYRCAFRLLRRRGHAVRLATDSALLAEEYAALARRPVAVFPLPHTPAAPEAAAGDQPAAPSVFLMPGHSSLAKGLDLVSELAGRWPDDFDGIRLRIQVSRWIPGNAQEVRAVLDRLGTLPFVELLDGSPDSATFHGWMRDADVVLAAYNPAVYGGQTSGIFTDAAALGKPVITTAGTWMQGEIQSGRAAGALLARYSCDALMEAIRAVRRDWSTLQREANEASARCRAFHNARMLVDRLAELRGAT